MSKRDAGLRAILLWALVCCAPAVPVPEPDLEQAEEEVRQAVEQAQRKVREEPRSASAWGALGDRYRAHLWLREAAACYAEAQRLEPEKFDWPYRRGKALRVEDPQEAARAFERALALAPGEPMAHYYLADALVRIGEPSRAREHYTRALELDPALADALVGLGQLALSENRLEEAEGLLRRALVLENDHPAAHLALAQVLARTGRQSEARGHADAGRRSLRRGASPDPRDPMQLEPAGSVVRSGLARRLLREGRTEQALQELDRIVALHPELATPHYLRGVALVRLSRAAEAEREFRRALELDPLMAEAHLALGQLYLAQPQEAARAYAHFTAAAALRPDEAPAHLGRAEAALGLQRLEEARAALEAALRLDPDLPLAHYRLGLLAAMRGDTRAARASLERAERLLLQEATEASLPDAPGEALLPRVRRALLALGEDSAPRRSSRE